MTTRNDLITALQSAQYDKRSVMDAIKNYPEEVDLLMSAKDNNGETLFRPIEVDDILANCSRLEAFNKESISEILNDPEKVEQIVQPVNRAYEFGLMLGFSLQEKAKDASVERITSSLFKDSSYKR